MRNLLFYGLESDSDLIVAMKGVNRFRRKHTAINHSRKCGEPYH